MGLTGGADRLGRAVRVMRIQARLGFAVAASCGLAFGYVANAGSEDQRAFVFLWAFFAAVAALVSAGVHKAAGAAATGSRGGRVAGVVAELLVILFGVWFWPLLPLTLLAPLYVLFLLGGVQPQ